MKTKLLFSLLGGLFASSIAFAGIPEDITAKFPQAVGAKISPAFSNFWSVVKGDEVIYVSDDLKYFISGNVIEAETQKNLTQALAEANRPKVKISELKLKDAIKVRDGGSGAKKIYVFSDPECPYCQRLEKSFDQLKNITVYVFPMPLASLHPSAPAISESAWCAKDQGKAWHDYVANNVEIAPAKCDNPIERNLAIAAKYQIRGTPAIVFEDGTIVPGAITAREIQARADKAK